MRNPLFYYKFLVRAINVDSALKKLNRAKIDIFNAIKVDNHTIQFCSKEYKKVLLIFQGSCYNISILKFGGLFGLLHKAKQAPFHIIGVFLLLFVLIFANQMVFKIEVFGSGNYYQGEVHSVLEKYGIAEYRPYSKDFEKNIKAELLSMPCVSFCSIEKKGGILQIEIETAPPEIKRMCVGENLTCNTQGIVSSVVVISGTPTVNVGDTVDIGDTLIVGESVVQTPSGEVSRKVIAIGKVELECKKTAFYKAQQESDEELSRSYSEILIEIGDLPIIDKTHTVSFDGDVVIYEVAITYIATLSINMY